MFEPTPYAMINTSSATNESMMRRVHEQVDREYSGNGSIAAQLKMAGSRSIEAREAKDAVLPTKIKGIGTNQPPITSTQHNLTFGRVN